MAKRRTAKRKTAQRSATATPVPPVQLRDLRLCNCACSLGAGRAPAIKQTITLKIAAQGEVQDALLLTVAFSLLGEAPEGQDGMRIEATFAALYVIDSLDDFTPEQVGDFLPQIGLNNLWPYWREFVQSTTVRMGLPPLRLPLLRHDQLSTAQLTIEKLPPETAPRDDVGGQAPEQSATRKTGSTASKPSS